MRVLFFGCKLFSVSAAEISRGLVVHSVDCRHLRKKEIHTTCRTFYTRFELVDTHRNGKLDESDILEALKAAVLGLLLRSDELLNERTLALIFLDIHRLLCSHLCHFNMKLKRPNDTIFLYILTAFHSYSVTKSTDNRQINILFDNQVLYSVSVLLRVAAATTNYLRNFRPNVVSVDMGFRLLLWMVKRSKHRLDDFEADF